jgi:hypothetical protein
MERAPFGGRILTHLLFTHKASPRICRNVPLQPRYSWLFT